jgi:hypothetical protein
MEASANPLASARFSEKEPWWELPEPTSVLGRLERYSDILGDGFVDEVATDHRFDESVQAWGDERISAERDQLQDALVGLGSARRVMAANQQDQTRARREIGDALQRADEQRQKAEAMKGRFSGKSRDLRNAHRAAEQREYAEARKQAEKLRELERTEATLRQPDRWIDPDKVKLALAIERDGARRDREARESARSQAETLVISPAEDWEVVIGTRRRFERLEPQVKAHSRWARGLSDDELLQEYERATANDSELIDPQVAKRTLVLEHTERELQETLSGDQQEIWTLESSLAASEVEMGSSDELEEAIENGGPEELVEEGRWRRQARDRIARLRLRIEAGFDRLVDVQDERASMAEDGNDLDHLLLGAQETIGLQVALKQELRVRTTTEAILAGAEPEDAARVAHELQTSTIEAPEMDATPGLELGPEV